MTWVGLLAELLGENEKTDREAYPQVAGLLAKTPARTRLRMAVSEASGTPEGSTYGVNRSSGSRPIASA